MALVGHESIGWGKAPVDLMIQQHPLHHASVHGVPPIAQAVWASVRPAAPDSALAPLVVSVPDAFTTFEAWYEREIGSPFLTLLDHEIPETPVVDF